MPIASSATLLFQIMKNGLIALVVILVALLVGAGIFAATADAQSVRVSPAPAPRVAPAPAPRVTPPPVSRPAPSNPPSRQHASPSAPSPFHFPFFYGPGERGGAPDEEREIEELPSGGGIGVGGIIFAGVLLLGGGALIAVSRRSW